MAVFTHWLSFHSRSGNYIKPELFFWLPVIPDAIMGFMKNQCLLENKSAVRGIASDVDGYEFVGASNRGTRIHNLPDSQDKFYSDFKEHSCVLLPAFSGIRVMMMPIVIGDLSSIPESLNTYKDVLEKMFSMQDHKNEVGYLTIDEKTVEAGESHRRQGKHVDGIHRRESCWNYKKEDVWKGGFGESAGTYGGGSGEYHLKRIASGVKNTINPNSKNGTGMLTVSSYPACKSWRQEFIGWPGINGECDHLADQCKEECSQLFQADVVYWVDPLCVHESLVLPKNIKRQFVRLSLPSSAPWFKQYTENPLGVKPTGIILEEREFMNESYGKV